MAEKPRKRHKQPARRSSASTPDSGNSGALVDIEGPGVLIHFRDGYEPKLSVAEVELLAAKMASLGAQRGKCGFVAVARWDGTPRPPVRLIIMTEETFRTMLARGLHYQEPKRNRRYSRSGARPRSGHRLARG